MFPLLECILYCIILLCAWVSKKSFFRVRPPKAATARPFNLQSSRGQSPKTSTAKLSPTPLLRPSALPTSIQAYPSFIDKLLGLDFLRPSGTNCGPDLPILYFLSTAASTTHDIPNCPTLYLSESQTSLLRLHTQDSPAIHPTTPRLQKAVLAPQDRRQKAYRRLRHLIP